MAVWKSITSNSEAKFYKLRLKWWARFVQSQRWEDWKYNEVGSTKIINWALKSLSLWEWEFDWNKIYTIKFQLKDTNLDELYFIDVNVMTWLWRSLISSLLNLNELWKILELSLYTKKYTDRNWKPALADWLWINYNWDNLRWKFNIADRTDWSWLPAVNNVKIQWKDALDSFDRDMFLIDLFRKHLETLSEPTTLAEMPTKIENAPLQQEEQVKKDEEEISIEDIPF